jgi:hypothetical protein
LSVSSKLKFWNWLVYYRHVGSLKAGKQGALQS